MHCLYFSAADGTAKLGFKFNDETMDTSLVLVFRCLTTVFLTF